MKQPHEDIIGTDRGDDDLLSLDMRAVAHRDALIAVVQHLWTATMVGNPAPVVERMSARMRSPQPGDLVIEPAMSRPRRDLDTRIKALGYLIEKRTEWWNTDEEWEVEEGYGDERPTDEAWYVQYGPDPADVCRWVNCKFITVPISEEFAKPAGMRDGTGTTFTRDSVLGSLADSGFELKIP
jgi:hypothetical protein